MENKIYDENELVQVYIVNDDLLMEKGKASAQTAHVATLLTLVNQTSDEFIEWLRLGQKKIVKKASEKELLKLMNTLDHDGITYRSIRDFGLTEIPVNSLTVVGLGPMKRCEIDKYVKKRWRLLKD